MLKKTLLSAAIASSFALSGCLDDAPSTTENAGSTTNPAVINGVYPVFSPAEGKLPIPNDLIFDTDAGDGSFKYLGDANNPDPVTTALAGLSGASTVAPIDIAMSGAIDPTSLVGQDDPANQNVFLLELEYASGDPVRGLSISEPPTIIPGNQKPYAIEHKELDGTSYIRINPKQPLSPLKRYVVVISTGVTDAAGDSITQSPGAAGYAALTDASSNFSGALASLTPVQSLVGFWETIAFSAIPTLGNDDSNIALTYSFTTSGDAKVLNYIADPKQWLNDQLTRFLRLSAAEAAIGAGATDYAAIDGAANLAVTNFPSAEIQAALSPMFAVAPPAGCQSLTGASAIHCVSVGISGSIGEATFGTPQPANITFPAQVVAQGTLDVNDLNPGIPDGLVSATQGEVTVPYYSGLPTDADLGPAALKFKNWVANEELATLLNSMFYNVGLSIPQGRTAPAQDSNGDDFAPVTNPPVISDFTVAAKSSVVNYNFPFPKKQGDVTIPVLAIYPTTPAGDMKTMVWGHGLTGNRTQALAFGASLVATAKGSGNDVTVLAIDQPLHGIDETSALSTSDERHFGYYAASGQMVPTAIDLDTAGGSGSMFVNIESFLTTRDNNRQNVLDLSALTKSIDTIDFNQAGSDKSDPKIAEGVYYSGHSLGTISSQAFVSVANDANQVNALGAEITSDNIAGAAFFTPGGGITRFFENSPAFAGDIIDGLGALGFTTDTSSYQAFLNVLQGASDAFDAVNFVGSDGFKNTPALYVEAISDLVIPVSQNSEARTYNKITSNGFTIAGSVSYLSGAEPLVTISGASELETTTTANLTAPAVVRYNTCSMDHGTPSSGTSPDTATAPAAAYLENVNHVVELVDSSSVTLSSNAVSSLIETQTSPLPNWIDNATDRDAHCNP